MTEDSKVGLYLEYLDLVLEGQSDLKAIENKEVEELLKTAIQMINIDFSMKSKIRESLKQKLIDIFTCHDKQLINEYLCHEDEDELMEDELSLASAAGLYESDMKNYLDSMGIYPSDNLL